MAAEPIHVEVEDEVPAIIERIRRSSAEEVHLVVPLRARFGQSRFNFQLLKQYSTRLGKRVSIWSPDPMVQRLAEESGFGAFRPAAPAPNGGAPGQAAPVSSGQRRPVPGSPPPGGPRNPPGGQLRPGGGGFQLPGGRPVPGAAGPGVPPSGAPPALQALVSRLAGAGRAARAASPAGLTRIRIAAPRRLPSPLGQYQQAQYVLYAGAVLLLLVGVAAVLLYFPTARVTLVAQAQPFSTPVDITSEPGKGPVHVRTVSLQKSANTGGNATGTKVTPGQPSAGQFTFVNTCPFALAIPNGQRLRSTTGAVFAQLGDVSVGQNQERTVDIKAVQAGQTGNVGAGQITGIDANQYNNCLTGSNRDPTGGGTDDQKQTVIQTSDIQSAKAALEQQLRQQMADELGRGAQKDKGETLVNPPIFQNEDFKTTHNADDPSPTFTATLNLTAEGDYYVADDVVRAFTDKLMSKVPRGQQITTNRVAPAFTVTAAAGGHLDFNGSASGYLAPEIDVERVKGQLAGKSAAQAHDVLTTLPVKRSVISQTPPLPLMPLSAGRIYIDYSVDPVTAAKTA
ncbi:MAG TPA: baseplate J/gp47 family protein [Candidatus Dormibacteraeota bacterium]